jgi:16S rRNA (cytosine967-C5)-methyltransferase
VSAPPPRQGRQVPGRAGEDGRKLARRTPAGSAAPKPPAREGAAAAVAALAPPAPRKPRPEAVTARRVALDVLDRVLGPEPRPFDEAFQAHRGLERLAVRDRAFARLLVTTVLRRLGQLDKAVLPLLRYRPKSRSVTNMLRLGAAQLLFLSTPHHAAVGETVRLAQGPHTREVPLLNAVLRRVAAGGRALLEGQDEARLNTPRWLFEGWAAAYGEEAAAGIARAHAGEPPLDLSVRRDPERWAATLGAELLPTGTLRRRSGGLIEALPGFDEGAWWVQDAAAALPALLMGEVRGRRVLDMCAAPGGKTAQLCAAGANVTAVERSPRRAEFLAGNLARLGMRAEIVVADANEWEGPSGGGFDAVLLDAPCSATGTIRRNPDIPWLKEPGDVTRLVEAQDRLLASAARLARPGAAIVYAVCSLQPEEGPERVAAALAAGGPLERDPVRRGELRGLEADLTGQGEVRTLPTHMAASGGLDGFFIARLRRRATAAG